MDAIVGDKAVAELYLPQIIAPRELLERVVGDVHKTAHIDMPQPIRTLAAAKGHHPVVSDLLAAAQVEEPERVTAPSDVAQAVVGDLLTVKELELVQGLAALGEALEPLFVVSTSRVSI